MKMDILVQSVSGSVKHATIGLISFRKTFLSVSFATFCSTGPAAKAKRTRPPDRHALTSVLQALGTANFYIAPGFLFHVSDKVIRMGCLLPLSLFPQS